MADLKILTNEIFNGLVEAGMDTEQLRGYGSKGPSSYFMSIVYKALRKAENIDEGTCGYDRDIKGNKFTTPGGLEEILQSILVKKNLKIK
jgi:hypothetical protein